MADNQVYSDHYEMKLDNGPAMYEVPQESLRLEGHSIQCSPPELVYEPSAEANIYASPNLCSENGVRYYFTLCILS